MNSTNMKKVRLMRKKVNLKAGEEQNQIKRKKEKRDKRKSGQIGKNIVKI